MNSYLSYLKEHNHGIYISKGELGEKVPFIIYKENVELGKIYFKTLHKIKNGDFYFNEGLMTKEFFNYCIKTKVLKEVDFFSELTELATKNSKKNA